jgi:single-strand DNA-binding protein
VAHSPVSIAGIQQARPAATAPGGHPMGEAFMNDTYVTVCGNIVDQPRHLQTAGGSLAKFRLAAKPSSFRDGIWVDGEASFYDVTCWRKVADHVAGSLAKGEPVLVHGRLMVREWVTENSSGKSVEITAEHVGHDLRFGTSTFRRAGRAPAATPEFANAEFAPAPDEAAEQEDTAAA